jgi:hypothetical protein
MLHRGLISKGAGNIWEVIRDTTRALVPQSVRFSLQTAFGGHPAIYRFAVGRFGVRAATLVDRKTDVCIEAPPGSGNSFVVQSFWLANPDTVIAHHHHVAAQVMAARSFGVPVLTILRNPIDCVLARVVDPSKQSDITLLLRRWMGFWTGVEPLLDQIACSTFESMVKDPSSCIDLINSTFGSGFSRTLPTQDEVFEIMHQERRRTNPVSQNGEQYHPNVPDPAKAELKRRIRPLVERHRLTEPALEQYRLLTATLSTMH